ncbi:hypothetical protein [Microbacterium sp. LWO13-1.2]|uniref:hypothetical protein n=1 Tax=unclassified Microbacterium TaxID=2609290 RepID=UPI0031396C5C
MELTPKQIARTLFAPTVFSRDDLLSRGFSPRQLTTAVRSGRLKRLRRDRYARPEVPLEIAEAVRIGGRLTCLSLLKLLGIFVLDVTKAHVHVPRNSSRLTAPTGGTCRLHWGLTSSAEPRHVTPLNDAIRHSLRCQTSRASLATLDSLVHHRVVTMTQLETIFLDLPSRFHALLRLIDPSAASGPETFVRLMLRTLGVPYETQVEIPGVGFVDFLVDGWLIIECDSKEFHEGWGKQKEDRYRDLAAARLGYMTIRPLASDVLYRAAEVQEALRQIIEVLGPRFSPQSRSVLRKNPPRRGRLRVSGFDSTKDS